MSTRTMESTRNRMSRTVAVVLMALVLLLALGVSGSPGSAEKNEAEQPVLRLAMSGAFMPFSGMTDDDTLQGIDADIAKALAERMGYAPQLVKADWVGIQAGLNIERYELICGSMAITEQRRETLHFSLPYYVSGAQVFVRAGTRGLEGLNVGTTELSTYSEYITANPEQFPNITLKEYSGEAQLLSAMREGEIDAFVTDLLVGGYHIQTGNAGDIERFGDLLYVEACGIAARHTDEGAALIRRVNHALLDMLADGSYARIMREWTGVVPDVHELMRAWADHLHADSD